MSEEKNYKSWLKIDFNYGKPDISDLVKYQSELENIVNKSGKGEVDGHDIATDLSDGSYWIVCTNPQEIFDLIKTSLSTTMLVKVRKVQKREQGEESYTTVFSA